ncbi:MAG: hypothetical protein ACE5R6_05510 [Candidatus Heimdallarchaeota archaeon]
MIISSIIGNITIILKDHPENLNLQLLQEADVRTSRYAWLLSLQTSRRKMTPVNTHQLARQLEQAAKGSIYKLYSVIYHSQELNSLTTSKVHPTESLRNHLISTANWTLFLLRTQISLPHLLRQPSQESQVELLALSRRKILGTLLSQSLRGEFRAK